MIDVDNQPDLDDVLDALSTSYEKDKTTEKKTREIPNLDDALSDDDVYSFVLSQLKEVIESNAEVIEQSKDMAIQGGTPDYIEAHSKVVKSQTDLLNSMLSTMMEKKKLKQVDKHKTKDLELKERALDEKKPYGELTNGTTNIQNNYLITRANRDDAFDAMFENDPEKRAKAQQKIKMLNGIVDADSETITE